MHVEIPNGYILEAHIDKEVFGTLRTLGEAIDMCYEQIENKLYELEIYRLYSTAVTTQYILSGKVRCN